MSGSTSVGSDRSGTTETRGTSHLVEFRTGVRTAGRTGASTEVVLSVGYLHGRPVLFDLRVLRGSLVTPGDSSGPVSCQDLPTVLNRGRLVLG